MVENSTRWHRPNGFAKRVLDHDTPDHDTLDRDVPDRELTGIDNAIAVLACGVAFSPFSKTPAGDG
ncbi:MAG: hypothetical protein WBD31_31920 [Rubripirellula sp.]